MLASQIRLENARPINTFAPQQCTPGSVHTMPTPDAAASHVPQFEFPVADAVGLEFQARRAELTLTTHSEPTARISFPDGGHDEFTVRMETPMLTVSQCKPGLLARMVSKDAVVVEIALPEGSNVTVGIGEGSIAVAATLEKSSLTLGRGTLSVHRNFAPLVATVDQGDTTIGFVAAPLRLNQRKGQASIDQLRAPAQVSVGGVKLTVADMHATLDVVASSSTVAVERAHEGIFELSSPDARATLGVVPGTPVVTEVSGFKPSINLAISAREPIPGEPHVRVRANGMQPVVEVVAVER